MKKPYTDDLFNANTFIRTFDSDGSTESEYVWHRDKTDRVVEVISVGDGSPEWEFQFEDDIPEKLNKGDIFNIPKEFYHRLIRGSGKLVLKIIEIT